MKYTLLAFSSFNFVATKVLLGFSVHRMLTSNWVILFEADFLSRVLRVFGSVVGTVATKLTYQPDQLSLCILLCHNFPYVR